MAWTCTSNRDLWEKVVLTCVECPEVHLLAVKSVSRCVATDGAANVELRVRDTGRLASPRKSAALVRAVLSHPRPAIAHAGRPRIGLALVQELVRCTRDDHRFESGLGCNRIRRDRADRPCPSRGRPLRTTRELESTATGARAFVEEP